MMKYLVCFSLFLSSICFAEPVFTNLKKGEAAPFDGVLLSPEAAATMMAEKEAAEKKAKLEERVNCQKEQEELKAEISYLTIDKNSLLKEKKVVEEIKGNEITRLRKLIEDAPNDYAIAWYAGGALTGIALSLAIFWLSVQTVN